MEWLFDRETDKKLGQNLCWQTLKMGWCGQSSYTGRFITIRLFPTAELFYKPADQRHSLLPVSRPQASLDSLHFTKLFSSSEAENTNSSFSLRKGAGRVPDQLKEAQLGASFPCALKDFDLMISKIFSNLADSMIHTIVYRILCELQWTSKVATDNSVWLSLSTEAEGPLVTKRWFQGPAAMYRD